MNLGFIKSTGIFAIAGAYRSLCLVLLMPLWTTYLDPAAIGLFAVVMTVSQILSRVGSFGLNASLTRFYIDYEQNPKRYAQFFTSVVCSLFVATIIICVGLWMSQDSLGSLLLGSDNDYLWSYIYVLYLCALVTGICGAIYIVEGNAKGAFVVTVYPQTAGLVVGLILVVYYDLGLPGRLDGLIVGEIIAATCCLIILVNKFATRHLSKTDMREAWLFGLPLVIHSVSQLLLQAGDRIVLLKMSSAADVGKYTVATSLVGGMLLLQGAANQVWAPKLLRLVKRRDESEDSEVDFDKMLQHSFEIWISVFAIISGGLIIFGKEMVSLMTGQEAYLGSFRYITPLAIGALLTGVYFYGINVVMYTKKNKLIPLITGLTGVFNIALNILLIPRYGPLAAAWTTLLCNGILLVAVHCYSRTISSIRYQYTTLVLALLMLTVCATGMNYFDQALPDAWYRTCGWKILILLLLAGALWFTPRGRLRKLF